jgi:hypothetical protein
MDAHRHHAFLGYAWADDQPFDAVGRPLERCDGGHRSGWVSTFHDRLRKHLGRAIGRVEEGERIWIDYERLRGSDPLYASIAGELAASALLVPILSRGWFASRWCREEFAAFVAGHDRADLRLFPVWMEPVNREAIDTEGGRAIWDRLRQAPDGRIGYPFWYLDEAKRPRTLWFPLMDPTERRYGDTQQDLARDMAAQLQSLRQPVAGMSEAREESPAAAPQTEGAPVPQPIPGEHLVMVNGGRHDAEVVQSVADTLASRHGLGYVIPLQAQRPVADGLKPSELRRDLRANLKLATAVLTVFRSGPVDQVQEQLRECLQAATRRPDRPPRLDLCHDGVRPLTFRPQCLHVHRVSADCGSDCANDCAAAFAAALHDEAAR